MGNGGHPLVTRAGGAKWLTALVVAVVLLTTACSDDDGQAANSTSSTTPSSPTTTSTTTSTISTPEPTSGADSLEQELVDRYTTFWEVRFEANQAPPNPDDPRLAEYATGAQLQNVIDETQRNLDDGVALRRPEDSVARSTVRVVGIDGDEATLQECVVDDGIVYRVDTGEVVNDTVATHSVQATMRKIDGIWKVAEATLLQRWEGVAGCALAEES